jgi:hypothetical protein
MQTIITNHIVVGNRRDAADSAGMKRLGITHVLNVAQQLPNSYPQSFVYHKIDLIGMYSVAPVHCIVLPFVDLWNCSVVHASPPIVTSLTSLVVYCRCSRDKHLGGIRRGDLVHQESGGDEGACAGALCVG